MKDYKLRVEELCLVLDEVKEYRTSTLAEKKISFCSIYLQIKQRIEEEATSIMEGNI